MENIVILQIIAFGLCFILLFVFTAKYRAAVANEADFDEEIDDLKFVTVSPNPTFKSRASILHSLQGATSLDLADIKEKSKELHYKVEELKISQNKSNADIAKQLARMEQRISTFEQEYITKLQPTLMSLIDELEKMKVQETKNED